MYRISNSDGQFVLVSGNSPREALVNMLKATHHPCGIVMEMEYYPNCWMIQNRWVFSVEPVGEWKDGVPTTPGWFVLEFSGGDRFVVVHAFNDDENVYRMEDQNNKGYVSDCVDVVVQHLPIPEPAEMPTVC